MTMASQVRTLVDSFSELTAQHIRLARVELAEDARFVGVRVGVIAALAPLVLAGYGFLCVAAALALRHVMAVELAFVVVGLANLVGGVAGIAAAARQLQGKRMLNETLAELEQTSALVVRHEEGAR